ncbi:MAG: rfaE bifunctional protein kinase chain/domain [Limisphaerales bacterium]|jgi:rfaE bifunctional protein kinase chain/domain
MAEQSDFSGAFFSKILGMPVLIVGDAMVDSYIEGQVDRVSPEAPVPVVFVNSKKDRLGGAANVALNIKAMGAEPILCTVTGTDAAAQRLITCLEKENLYSEGVLRSASRTTTVKTRVMTRNQQMLRIDEENTSPLSEADLKSFVSSIKEIISVRKPAALIFQDYNKGMLTPALIQEISGLCASESIPVCVDPKHQHFFEYKGSFLFKPNLREVIDSIPECPEDANPEHLNSAAEAIHERLGNQVTMITLGERGVFLHTPNESRIFPAHIRNIADVSGAGDTVISLAALGIAAGLDPSIWAQIANLAGGLVCESVGVVPVDRTQLMEEVQSLFHPES